MAEQLNKREGFDKNQGNNRSESAILFQVIRHIFQNWLLFLIICVVAAVVGYFYAKQKNPVYESYISFALESGEDDMSAAMGIANQLGIAFGGGTNVFAGDNILRIMMSRRIIEGTLLSADTIDNKVVTLIEYYRENVLPKYENGKDSKIHFFPGEKRENFSYSKDSVLYATFLDFRENHIIARRPEKNQNIYELMVTSQDEKFSKIFSEVLIQKTNHFYKEISSKKTKETLEILKQRVPEMKSKLDASISSRAAIEDANLNTAFAGAEVPQMKEITESKVYAGAYTELFKNLEAARFQYLKSIPLMQIIDGPRYPLKKIQPSGLVTAVIFAVVAGFLTLIIFIAIDIIKYLRLLLGSSSLTNSFQSKS